MNVFESSTSGFLDLLDRLSKCMKSLKLSQHNGFSAKHRELFTHWGHCCNGMAQDIWWVFGLDSAANSGRPALKSFVSLASGFS